MRGPLRVALPPAIASLAAIGAISVQAAAPLPPVTGMWVLRSTLSSPESIEKMVESARAAGVNTLLVQVRGRGEAFYRSDLEPRASDLDAQPDAFDPLATTLSLAHAAGLRVHAWVNVNLVASGATLPRSREHVAAKHPEWLMVPRALAATMGGIDPRSPAYLGTLSRWTRTHTDRVEGLYLSPLVPAAQAHTAEVVRELVERYPIDGLHLDYIRYPNEEFDYGRGALAEFRATVVSWVTAAERVRLDRAARTVPAAWADALAPAWESFRRERLTMLVARLARAAQEVEPGLTISAAVLPDPAVARDRHFQEWGAWASDGLLDVVCPMVYTTDAAEFATQVANVRRAAGGAPVWAGIGAHRLPAARTADHVRLARRGGAAGILLYSYDSLSAGTAPSSNYLSALRPVLVEGGEAVTDGPSR
jgi:uncharacterized lipoprotein YddW (UPF0748 family)